MRELTFKLPKGKPPFIGVRFEDVFKGETLNADLVLNYKHSEFILFLEPIGERFINLKLCSEDQPIMRKYDRLEYHKHEFKAFLQFKADKMNFGHIIKTYSYDLPVKIRSTREMFVLKIKEIKVLYEQ